MLRVKVRVKELYAPTLSFVKNISTVERYLLLVKLWIKQNIEVLSPVNQNCNQVKNTATFFASNSSEIFFFSKY